MVVMHWKDGFVRHCVDGAEVEVPDLQLPNASG